VGIVILASNFSGARSSQTAESAEPPVIRAGLEQLQAAVEQDPTSADARRRLGIALRKSGELDAAIEQLERAVELAPRDLDCLLSLGLGYSAARRLPEARRIYERLLAISPGHVKALSNLGNVALRQGDEQRAIEAYRRAIAADPEYLLAHYRLADALRMTGQTDQAYAVYSKVRELTPENRMEYHAFVESLYQIAALEFLKGEDASVERHLKELIAQVPNHHSAYYLLGQVLVRAGRIEEAQKAMEIHMKIQSRRKPSGQDMGG
jgi:tetratricopeptide (TPR) repeat protein